MIKVKIGKKKQINEIVGTIAIALGALLVGALLGLFASLKPLIEKAGKKLDEGAKKTEDAVAKSSLPEDTKKQFLEKLNAAKQDLQNTLKEVQEKAKNAKSAAALPKRPSAMISEKIKVVLDVIMEIKEALSEDESLKTELEAAEKEVKECETTIKNIDLTAIIASKKDTKGMWASVAELQTPFSEESKWLEFADKVASKAEPTKSNIKTAPAAA